MGIMRRIKQIFGAAGTTVSQLFGKDAKARRTDADAVMQKFTGWVYVCASRNGSTCASVPLRLYARGAVSTQAKAWYAARPVPGHVRKWLGKQAGEAGEVVELTDHPLLTLLREANPIETGFGLKELTVIYQELVGNAYWYLEPHTDPVRAGQPKAVWPLLPNLMKVIPNKARNGVQGYLYGNNPATQVAYTADEIIHFKYPNPNSSVIGLGPAQAGIMAVNRKAAMDEYKQALYDNHCRPDFVISVPDGTTDAEITSLYLQWDKRFRTRGKDFTKVGRPWITTSEKELKTIGWAPKDTHDIPQAKLDRDEIYQMFGNPVTMGEISKSRAEAEAGEYAYMLHSILPRLRRFEQTLNEFLVPLFDERLFLAFDNPVPENREQMRQDIDTYVGKRVVTVNEARAWINLDPVDGGDEFAALPVPVVPAAATSPADDEDDNEDEGKGVTPAVASGFHSHTRSVGS